MDIHEKTIQADLLLAGITQLVTVLVADKIHQQCIFRKNCASVPEERSAIPLQTEQSSAG